MPHDLLPLFPLAVVLLPHNELPLHIFEERYKEMIGQAIQNSSEFGVVLASDDGISQIGCTASVEEVLKQYPDGRMDILTMGRRRFRIHELNNEQTYLRGEVEFLADEEITVPAAMRTKATELARLLWPDLDLDETTADLSYQLARRITDLQFRQEMLGSRREADRLRRLIGFLPTYADRLEKINKIREAAPRNGHSHLPLPSQES
jgi:Lon protease-like protein